MVQTKEIKLYSWETTIAFVCKATVMEIGVSIRWIIYWEMMAECLAEKYLSSDKSLHNKFIETTPSAAGLCNTDNNFFFPENPYSSSPLRNLWTLNSKIKLTSTKNE